MKKITPKFSWEAPTFGHFLKVEEENLGCERQQNSEENPYEYFIGNDEEGKPWSIYVFEKPNYTTLIRVIVDTPPLETPQWLVKLLDSYYELLKKWPQAENNPQIKIVYAYG